MNPIASASNGEEGGLKKKLETILGRRLCRGITKTTAPFQITGL